MIGHCVQLCLTAGSFSKTLPTIKVITVVIIRKPLTLITVYIQTVTSNCVLLLP